VSFKRVHENAKHADDDVDLPYKMAKLLIKKGVLVGLENSGAMERMNTRNFSSWNMCCLWPRQRAGLQLITLIRQKGIDAQCGTLEIGKMPLYSSL
jgi:hypothetical protein